MFVGFFFLTVSTAIVLTPSDARLLNLLPASQDLAVRAQEGKTAALSAFLPAAMVPENPTVATVTLPPSVDSLKSEVTSATRNLVILVTASSLLASCIVIAITMIIAVRERHEEIGIYRAVGVPRARVAQKFLVEAVCTALIGSTAGWVIGVLISATISQLSGWTTQFPPVLWLLPCVGLIVGLAGGVAPAVHAARLDPNSLLKDGGNTPSAVARRPGGPKPKGWLMLVLRWLLICVLGVLAALAAAIAISLLWAWVPPEREVVFLQGAITSSAGVIYLTTSAVFVLAASACSAVLWTHRRSKTGVAPRK